MSVIGRGGRGQKLPMNSAKKTADIAEWGVKNLEKNANGVYGWSLGAI